MAERRSFVDLDLAPPLAAWAALLIVMATGWTGPIRVVAARLAGAVFAAVHHAEVVAHRVGEPYGTLVLAMRSR
jgi:Ca2+:H+ antiporter